MKYAIPAGRIPALTANLDRLSKRALKMGLEPIRYTVLDKFENKRLGGYDGCDVIARDVYQNIEIEGETPVFNGWELVAAVEYLDTGAAVVKSLDYDFVCPSHYRENKPYCEHCNTHKVKRYTMILRSVETGELKMVGKTCMKDFLGDDVEAVVSRFNWIMQIVDELSDPDSDYYGSGGEHYFDVNTVLKYAAQFTLIEGYKPVSHDDCTRDMVIMSLTNPKSRISISDDAVEYAENAKEWIVNNTEVNDFMLNVKALVDSGFITFKMIGFIVGAIGGYNAHLNREAKRKADTASILNEHFGEVKKRYTFDFTMIKMTTIEGYYGTTWIYTFRDADNRTFVWFASKRLYDNNDTTVVAGETIKVKATIKKHDEFRGIKQTVVTRVAPVK